MEKETYECHDCRAPFVRTVVQFDGLVFGNVRCAACIEKWNETTRKMKSAERAAEQDAAWSRVCPAAYRDTDESHPGLNPLALEAVRRYEPRAARGLGLIGSTGQGKTRCAFLALRRAHTAGLRVNSVSHNRFSRLAMDAFSGTTEERGNARAALDFLKRADVLLLDDLGKAPSTERADAELEELIEARTSNNKPLLWTANGSGEWLIARLGADRGEPAIRRLAEFCEIVNLEGGAR
jgi:DNA replication protein DnaC